MCVEEVVEEDVRVMWRSCWKRRLGPDSRSKQAEDNSFARLVIAAPVEEEELSVWTPLIH